VEEETPEIIEESEEETPEPEVEEETEPAEPAPKAPKEVVVYETKVEKLTPGMTMDEILEFADGRPLVLDIQHDACQPCQELAPEFEALMERTKETYPDTLFFNIDAMDFANRDLLMNSLRISSVPSFRIYVNGELSASVNGGNNYDQVEEALQDAIEKHEGDDEIVTDEDLSDDGLTIEDDTTENLTDDTYNVEDDTFEEI